MTSEVFPYFLGIVRYTYALPVKQDSCFYDGTHSSNIRWCPIKYVTPFLFDMNQVWQKAKKVACAKRSFSHWLRAFPVIPAYRGCLDHQSFAISFPWKREQAAFDRILLQNFEWKCKTRHASIFKGYNKCPKYRRCKNVEYRRIVRGTTIIEWLFSNMISYTTNLVLEVCICQLIFTLPTALVGLLSKSNAFT